MGGNFKPIPSSDKTIEWCHVNRVEVHVRLLELVRGRAIDHPASKLGQSEELLRESPEAFPLVEQGRLRIGVAFEEVNRLLVVPVPRRSDGQVQAAGTEACGRDIGKGQ